jgi:hypothetical protein
LHPQDGTLSGAIIMDDGVILTGTTFDPGGGNHRGEIYKLTKQGVVDPAFQIQKISTEFDSSARRNFGVLRTPQNKLIAYTAIKDNIRLYKFDSTGQPISSFGTAGLRDLNVNQGQSLFLLQVLVDDANVFLLYIDLKERTPLRIVKINADTGNPDEGYGTNGTRIASLPSTMYAAFFSAQLIGGNIWLSGLTSDSAGNKFALLKINTSGNLEPGFGDQGALTFSSPNSTTKAEQLRSVELLPDGSILAFGVKSIGGTWQDPSSGAIKNIDSMALTVSKLRPNGSLETGFGDGGTMSINAIQPNSAFFLKGYVRAGKIIVVHQPRNVGESPVQPLVLITLNESGGIERIVHAAPDPTQIDLTYASNRDPAKIWAFEPLSDGSIFTVGPLCSLAFNPCRMQVGMARYEP